VLWALVGSEASAGQAYRGGLQVRGQESALLNGEDWTRENQ
jgi:hypothetical protein